MRAVTGSVASSKPVSLSKAATVISRFAANENAAHPEVLAYVRRASAAFDELVYFHREIRAAQKRPELENLVEKEERKKKRKRSSNELVVDQDGAATDRDHGKIRANTNLADGNMNLQRGGAEVESDRETRKKKKRKANDEQRSELAESGDKNVVSDGILVEKARDCGDGTEFGEDGKRGKKKKEKMKHKRKEEGIVEVLEQKHKTDLDVTEELEHLKDQKEQRKKKNKKMIEGKIS